MSRDMGEILLLAFDANTPVACLLDAHYTYP
jgi:hypothetical protein